MRRKLIKTTALSIATALSLAGCGIVGNAAPAKSTSVVVVGANESNAAPITGALTVDHELSRLTAADATVHFVVPDGVPSVSTHSFNLAPDGNNGLIQQENLALETAKLSKFFRSLNATVPQNDPLGALELAANFLHGTSSTGVPEIVVINSGLSTVAPLGFQNGILADTPKEVVASLKSDDELPDLAGISVDWFGLGDVRGPQSELTIAEQENLTSIWSAILTACGATTASFNPSPLAGDPGAGLPVVTPTPVGTVSSLTGQMVSDLGTRSVHFVPGKAIYLDPTRAATVLSGLASQIIAGGYTRINVSGTAALPGYRPLSLARASAVASSLERYGVPSSEITVEGVGTHFNGFVPDVINGHFDNTLAELDRLVIVTSSK